jgi:hypothetical protein
VKRRPDQVERLERPRLDHAQPRALTVGGLERELDASGRLAVGRPPEHESLGRRDVLHPAALDGGAGAEAGVASYPQFELHLVGQPPVTGDRVPDLLRRSRERQLALDAIRH